MHAHKAKALWTRTEWTVKVSCFFKNKSEKVSNIQVNAFCTAVNHLHKCWERKPETFNPSASIINLCAAIMVRKIERKILSSFALAAFYTSTGYFTRELQYFPEEVNLQKKMYLFIHLTSTS